MIAAINAEFAKYPAARIAHDLDGLGVPAGKVRNIAEVYEWDQTKSQGLLIDVEHAALGPITLPGPPLRFFEPRREPRLAHTAPPTLNQHGDAIRAWLDAPQ